MYYKVNGIPLTKMACWRSGLTHIPLKDTYTGSNPVQATIKVNR